MDYAVHPVVALADGGTALSQLPSQVVASNPFTFTSTRRSPTAPGGNDAQMSDQSVGTGDLTGVHNTPLHVSGLVIFAIILVIGLRMTGFRFVVGANIASGLGG